MKQLKTIIVDIKNLFEQEEDYYKPVKIGNSYNSNYIEYGSNGDRNKTLSIKEQLDEIKRNLKYIINNLKKSGTWKIQLTINFVSSKDINEEGETLSKSVSIEIMIYGKAYEVIKELFE